MVYHLDPSVIDSAYRHRWRHYVRVQSSAVHEHVRYTHLREELSTKRAGIV